MGSQQQLGRPRWLGFEQRVSNRERRLKSSRVILRDLSQNHLEGLDDPAAALPWLQQARSTYDALWDALATDEHRVSFGDTFTRTGRALQRAHLHPALCSAKR